MGNFFDDLNDAANLAAAQTWWNDLGETLQKCLSPNLWNGGEKDYHFFTALLNNCSEKEIVIFGKNIGNSDINKLSKIPFAKVILNCPATDIELNVTDLSICDYGNWKTLKIKGLRVLRILKPHSSVFPLVQRGTDKFLDAIMLNNLNADTNKFTKLYCHQQIEDADVEALVGTGWFSELHCKGSSITDSMKTKFKNALHKVID